MLALLLAGFALLGAGTHRQSRLVFGRLLPANMRRGLRIAGMALLGFSLTATAIGPDAARRMVEWFGLASMAALATVAAGWLLDRRGF